ALAERLCADFAGAYARTAARVRLAQGRGAMADSGRGGGGGDPARTGLDLAGLGRGPCGGAPVRRRHAAGRLWLHHGGGVRGGLAYARRLAAAVAAADAVLLAAPDRGRGARAAPARRRSVPLGKDPARRQRDGRAGP